MSTPALLPVRYRGYVLFFHRADTCPKVSTASEDEGIAKGPSRITRNGQKVFLYNLCARL